MMTDFKNEPLFDFSNVEIRKAFEAELERVKRDFGKEYPLIIGGKKIFPDKGREVFHSTNPSKRGEIIATFPKASKADCDEAIRVAEGVFKEYSQLSAESRACILFRAANIMRRRKAELSATMVYEVGKNWIEAVADTCEAIDFLEFYGREILRYSERQPLTPYPGEFNELIYIPLGCGVVIPPWNFPLAILSGMTSAALACGNTVVLKPASDSPLIGYKFCEIMEEAGLPAGALNYLPGPGGEIGDYLVSHPRIRFISFTGSMAVGLRIVELAGKTQPEQIWIKRVIAEMGGKDCIIVEEDCDWESALSGVLTSAYGFQGQKCSACSRLILNERIYDKFIADLKERVKGIKIGDVRYFENWLGPVINERAFQSILNYIEVGKNEGRLVWGGEPADGTGYFIKPTIFADVNPNAKIAQEEIFGPVLAVIKAKDFEEALTIANNTKYGLTGSLYTKDRNKIEKAKRFFHVGNLYFNRKCTGALVGVHPFGGFNMSGTDSKAGGRDYLLLYLQAKSISEAL
uniref:L-glutamate gamma-semialdehyde dehydrogenase n=1 Tax=candidate division WOR-3 bacterium TaxID=2052148 RepID=A0A7C3YTG7_UNCW3